MSRLERQTMIKRLVTENEIHTQSELLALLEREDVRTTQATVSRDIHKLNLNEVDNDQGEAYYRTLDSSAFRPKYRTDEERLVDTIVETGVSLTRIEFTNFLTALPDSGQAIGVLTDRMHIHNPHILDCIAGNDTILILSESKGDVLEVSSYFQQCLHHP